MVDAWVGLGLVAEGARGCFLGESRQNFWVGEWEQGGVGGGVAWWESRVGLR